MAFHSAVAVVHAFLRLRRLDGTIALSAPQNSEKLIACIHRQTDIVAGLGRRKILSPRGGRGIS